MTKQEQFEKKAKDGKVRQLTRQIYTWEEEGQVLFGTVLKVEPFTEGQFDTEVKSYIIETDAGIITTVLGSATDKQLKDIDPVGMVIRIQYNGKKTLADGRQINLFDVKVA